ncbi:hypothetical protein NW755_012054 [Fusarium falciforme]|uniref:NmrA-like domain-containing protein n=1 Tax=Fusarium falciforme TaxID=195108 RepID=A0A9W8QVA8_9HYPO|nr:hypothetical protein NW755_012054 [Fusarium falciforme]
MSFNRIAVYGHRGWATTRIVAALIASGAPITVLHRAGSDTSALPASVPKIEVDVFDEDALVNALQNIDIVLSLVGDRDVNKEHGFVKAIPRTNVKLFVPSDLGLRYGEEGNFVPIIKEKDDLQRAVRDAGIPMTAVLIGNFAEFTLGCCAMGIDLARNRLVHTANSAKEKANMTTRDYVAAAYVSIFTANEIAKIQNRTISLTELAPTGDEIAVAMTQKNGAEPEITIHSLEKVQTAFKNCVEAGEIFALAWFCRKIWGTGELMAMLSSDVWEVPGYKKATLNDLIVSGKIEGYRDLPDFVVKYLEETMF